MHECPHCGKPMTARPSHCYEGGKPLTSTSNRGIPGFAVIVLVGVALTTLLLLGRALIG